MAVSPSPSVRVQPSPKTLLLLVCKSAGQRLSVCGLSVSAVSKAGMGLLRLGASRLKRREKKRSLPGAPERVIGPLATEGPEVPGAVEARLCRRVVVLGAPRVGKTCILRRFLRDGFQEQYEPTAEDFHRKLYHIRGETYQIDILDASGERDFPAKRRLSILTGDIFLLVFSLDDRSSFSEVCALRSEIIAAKSALLRRGLGAEMPVVVCANKADLPVERRAVSRSEALRELGDSCALYETSAKDGVNLEQAFQALAERGGLPPETGPSRHRRISIRSYQALRAARKAGRGRRPAVCEAPCGALYPLARRPSFGADLRQVLASCPERKASKTAKK